MLQPTHSYTRPNSPPAMPVSIPGAGALRFKGDLTQACPIRPENDRKHIDDDIYHDLMRAVPKVDLHEHQSGSSDLAFLKYVLISLKQDGKLKDIDCLDYEAVRRYYRAYISSERGKPFMGEELPTNDNQLTELTPEIIEQFRKVGLDAYRSTSGKINQHVKNIPAAFLLAHLFAMEVASENVRYVEYRVSPSGNAYGGYGNATVEDIIGAVDEGFKDAQLRLDRSRQTIDYGLIMLMERQARSKVKVPGSLDLRLGEILNHYAQDVMAGQKRSTAAIAKKIVKAVEAETSVRIKTDDTLTQNIRGLVTSIAQSKTPAEQALATGGEIVNLLEKQGTDKVATAVDMAKEAVRLRSTYNITGIDLAGDELNNPVGDFKPAFDVIKKHNEKMAAEGHPEKRIGITIHAGETPRSGDLNGWESIKEAIDAAWSPNTPVRIGHGIQLINSSKAMQDAFRAFVQNPNTLLGGSDTTAIRNMLKESSPLLKEIIEKNIVLEMCPKSNVMTYGVDPFLDGSISKLTVRSNPQHDAESYSAQSYKRHPAVFLSRLGVKVTLSSDNRTISNSDITNEFVKLYKYIGIRYQDVKKMVMDGLDGAFIFDPKTKKAVAEDMTKGFNTIESDPKHLIAIYKMANGGEPPHPFKLLLMSLWIYARKMGNAVQQFFADWAKPKLSHTPS